MRTLCDVCEVAPAHLFCAADEAALCHKCDEKVHACNKLASRHVRIELAETRAVPLCDICENASAFFFCGIDGTSLCLQCDMDVHIGGKKTHERYLLMAQRVELPVQKPGQDDNIPADKQPENLDGTNNHLNGLQKNGQNHIHHHHHHHHHHHEQENKNERGSPKLGADSNSIGPAVAIAVGAEVLQLHAERQPTSQMFDLNSQPQHLQIQASHPDKVHCSSLILYIGLLLPLNQMDVQ
ncbi:hypothetical protein CY35_03G106900 [Sphagnum magellanicum]|nr:hypothetical protein CY35_03G106900 [Sphagnum magellanicum]